MLVSRGLTGTAQLFICSIGNAENSAFKFMSNSPPPCNPSVSPQTPSMYYPLL